MKEFKSIDDILDFAMEEEQQAVDFYSRLAGQAKTDDMREIFESFAQEEISHKARLSKIKAEGIFTMPIEKVQDLKIADYTVSVKAQPDMTYEEALVLAMRKEKAAFKLYTALSDMAPTVELKEIFLALAIEESKHKLRFEVEYDEYVLRQN